MLLCWTGLWSITSGTMFLLLNCTATWGIILGLCSPLLFWTLDIISHTRSILLCLTRTIIHCTFSILMLGMRHYPWFMFYMLCWTWDIIHCTCYLLLCWTWDIIHGTSSTLLCLTWDIILDSCLYWSAWNETLSLIHVCIGVLDMRHYPWFMFSIGVLAMRHYPWFMFSIGVLDMRLYPWFMFCNGVLDMRQYPWFMFSIGVLHMRHYPWFMSVLVCLTWGLFGTWLLFLCWTGVWVWGLLRSDWWAGNPGLAGPDVWVCHVSQRPSVPVHSTPGNITAGRVAVYLNKKLLLCDVVHAWFSWFSLFIKIYSKSR